jgi:hypothetical protein
LLGIGGFITIGNEGSTAVTFVGPADLLIGRGFFAVIALVGCCRIDGRGFA